MFCDVCVECGTVTGTRRGRGVGSGVGVPRCRLESGTVIISRNRR